MGNQARLPRFCLLPGPALTAVGICRVDQWSILKYRSTFEVDEKIKQITISAKLGLFIVVSYLLNFLFGGAVSS